MFYKWKLAGCLIPACSSPFFPPFWCLINTTNLCCSGGPSIRCWLHFFTYQKNKCFCQLADIIQSRYIFILAPRPCRIPVEASIDCSPIRALQGNAPCHLGSSEGLHALPGGVHVNIVIPCACGELVVCVSWGLEEIRSAVANTAYWYV